MHDAYVITTPFITTIHSLAQLHRHVSMSDHMMQVELCGYGGKPEFKNYDIKGITLFSDLLKVCQNDLKNTGLIVDQELRTIHVKGKEIGGWERINAIVDESYNIDDVCFNQKLFSGKPRICIVFEFYRLKFYFMGGAVDDKPGYDCSLNFLCGSKQFGESFVNEYRVSNEKLIWASKLSEKHYGSLCDAGMQSEKDGLKSNNCAVFVINSLTPLKTDILAYMDTVGLLHQGGMCKCMILFRGVDYLKKSLQLHMTEPLTEGAIYLLLFKKTSKSHSESSNSSKASSTSTTTA